MNCMKCGVEIPENHVFCDHCLAVMDDYLIKPDTHIHLPKRDETVENIKRNTRKKRAPTTEEKLAILRTKVFRLRLLAAVLTLLLVFVSAFLGLQVYHDLSEEPATGKNYTIDTSTKTPLPTATGATTGE